jgi:tripartite-type tricarboxylate transporter receptor subunit TctC
MGSNKLIKPLFYGCLFIISIGLFKTAGAQEYPNRSIKLIVPFTPGGTTDAVARMLARQLEAQMGQTIVVENKPGANGILGSDMVAKSNPDGYTILHTSPSIATNEFIYKDLRIHFPRDFTPITTIATGTGYLILVGENSPIKNIRQLVSVAKEKSDGLSYGSAGIGNTTHLAAELLFAKADIKLLHIPYKGISESMNAAIAGDVQVILTPPTVALPFVKDKRLRAIAFTGSKRWSELPDVPTLSESVLSNYEINGGWFLWLLPNGVPSAVTNRLHNEITKALQTPQVREYILKGGYSPDGRSPEETRKFIEAEMVRYSEAVKAAGIKAQ